MKKKPWSRQQFDPACQVHGANIQQKEHKGNKYADKISQGYLRDIKSRYEQWIADNAAVVGPVMSEAPEDRDLVAKMVALRA